MTRFYFVLLLLCSFGVAASATEYMRVDRTLAPAGGLMTAEDFKRLWEEKNQPPLFDAIEEKKSYEVIKNLLDEGADVNARGVSNNTPLLTALSNDRRYKIVELLIKYGANINVKNESGKFPLMQSTIFCDESMTKLLLENGADVNMQDNDSETPLTRAVKMNVTGQAKLLIEHDAGSKPTEENISRALAYAKKCRYCDKSIVGLLKAAMEEANASKTKK